MDSTKEKLELGNGVSLGEVLEYEGMYKLSKEEARTVFLGTVEDIFCHCAVPTCEIENCGDEFYVERVGGGRIYIGCVHFSESQVEAVKDWLGRE